MEAMSLRRAAHCETLGAHQGDWRMTLRLLHHPKTVAFVAAALLLLTSTATAQQPRTDRAQRELLEELTFVGSDAAIARFCSVLKGDERAPEKLVRSRKFLVLTRRGGTWRVSWGQNTRLADTVPDSDCFLTLRKADGGA